MANQSARIRRLKSTLQEAASLTVLLLSVVSSVVMGAPLAASPEDAEPYQRGQPMMAATLNEIDIAYTQAGRADAPAVLLIMGLTASHRLWREDYVNGIVDSGYRVILFDNRDTGQSARLDDLGTPIWWWELLKNQLGFAPDPVYTLDDMAMDAIALLDHLDIDQAHIVGVSMGGMIAQQLVSAHPQRSRSLVSIMSTTGAADLPPPSAEAQADLMAIADGETADGSEALSEAEQLARLHDIGIYPGAMPRQLLAIVAAGDRSADVERISVPTLVQHGELDTLLPPAHGAHTAALINGAKHLVYPDMGHNMPSEVVPALLQDLLAHFERAEARAETRSPSLAWGAAD